MAKTSCSCYGDMLVNFEGAALAETRSIWLTSPCRKHTSENFAEAGEVTNEDGKRRGWKMSFKYDLLV